jgi:hypothetical protein
MTARISKLLMIKDVLTYGFGGAICCSKWQKWKRLPFGLFGNRKGGSYIWGMEPE